MSRVLHIISQIPGETGSGFTLRALVKEARYRDWQQAVVCALPNNSDTDLSDLETVFPLYFETDELDFPIPGMSDQMPYESTVWSTMSAESLRKYRLIWSRHIVKAVEKFKPDIIHSNHLWLLSSMLKDLFPDIPVVGHCHATGLRQLKSCPRLKEEIFTGINKLDKIFVLHGEQVTEVEHLLGINPGKITIVGAGYDKQVFYPDARIKKESTEILFVGKLAAAKGLPALIEAVNFCRSNCVKLRLHVAGGGSGVEADMLLKQLSRDTDRFEYHGILDQHGLADIMRSCSVCILPSQYEGLPLVLLEALACGCLLLATDLPGIVNEIKPVAGEYLQIVNRTTNALNGISNQLEKDAFTSELSAGLINVLQLFEQIDLIDMNQRAKQFSWNGVFSKIECIWKNLIDENAAVNT
jgi:glycosyltransferase involved in cell wall biosynthesis